MCLTGEKAFYCRAYMSAGFINTRRGKISNPASSWLLPNDHLLLNNNLTSHHIPLIITQLQVVIAHELGHIKCEHGVWITAANALALGLYSFGGMLGRNLGDQIQGMYAVTLGLDSCDCENAS